MIGKFSLSPKSEFNNPNTLALKVQMLYLCNVFIENLNYELQ